MDSKKVVHLQLKKAGNKKHEQEHYYFGSMKAIYSIFSQDDIGIGYNMLLISEKWNDNGSVFENEHCIIRIGELIRNKQKNSK